MKNASKKRQIRALLVSAILALSARHGWALSGSDQEWVQALSQGRKDFAAPAKGSLVWLHPWQALVSATKSATSSKGNRVRLYAIGGSAKWEFATTAAGEWFFSLIGASDPDGEAELLIDGKPFPLPRESNPVLAFWHVAQPIALATGKHTAEIAVVKPCTRTGMTFYVAFLSTTPGLDTQLFDSGLPRINALLINNFAHRLWRDFPLQCDWFLQDNQVHGEWGTEWGEDARGDFSAYLKTGRNDSLEKKLLATAADEIGATVSLDLPAGDPKWLEEYLRLCRQRRQARLKPLTALAPRIVYALHHNMGSIYLATETQGCGDGSELRLLDLSPLAKSEPIKDEPLFDAKNGIVRDPEVSFDGKRMLFAWRQTNKGINTTGQIAPATGNYKIYEMNLATRAVRQLTTDETYGADFEPCYLPNGDILFSSARCVQEVTCGWGDCSNLYLMNKDGKYARRIGFDQTQTAFPHLLGDGRVIYTRRDYNDRGQTYAHALFVMNPDGTKQTEYYKNNSCEPTSLQHTRQIPGATKTMSIAGGYHCDQGGKLVIVDINKGRQAYQGLTFFHWDPARKITSGDNFGREGEQYIYPFPLDASSFLVGFDPIGGYRFNKEGRVQSQNEHYALYYMTLEGRREMLASHPTLSSAQAAPVIAREIPPDRPSAAAYSKQTGICYVQNVYYGPGSAGIEKGSIKKIRINELYYKPITIGAAKWGPPKDEIGPGKKYSSGGLDSITPVGVGTASFDAKGILGEVDVHPDGSAMFELPARTPVFFQLIDQNGNVAQSMRSWTTLMPGENFSCVGCHEAKDAPPLANAQHTLAMQRPVQKLRPFAGVSSKPFSYAKMVQPIWNRNCVSCHAQGKEAEKIDLTDTVVQDDPTQSGESVTRRKFYQSYLTLLKVTRRSEKDQRLSPGTPNDWVNYWTRLRTVELIPPYDAGSAKSKLITLLKTGHGKTKLSNDEINTVSAWIDLNVPFIGEYDEMNDWSESDLARYNTKLDLRHKNEAIECKNIQEFLKNGQN